MTKNIVKLTEGKENCYQTFENAGILNFICCGFLDKSGICRDTVDEDYPFYTMVYILRGNGTYVDHKGLKIPVGAGDVFQRVPGRKHSLFINPESNWQEAFIGWNCSLLNSKAAREEILSKNFWPRKSGTLGKNIIIETLSILSVTDFEEPVFHIGISKKQISAFSELLTQLNKRPRHELSKMILPVMNLMQSLSNSRMEIEKNSSGNKEIIEKVYAILLADPSCRKKLPELLKEIPLSYSRIRSIFKHETGSSLEAFRLRSRIEAACRMLSNPGAMPKEVAEKLGYSDYFAFSRQFKEITGMSPRGFIH